MDSCLGGNEKRLKVYLKSKSIQHKKIAYGVKELYSLSFLLTAKSVKNVLKLKWNYGIHIWSSIKRMQVVGIECFELNNVSKNDKPLL